MNKAIIELSSISGDLGNVEEWRKKVVKILENERILGIKAGLEVAKDVAKRYGYQFDFPDPEKIKIQECVNSEQTEVKE